MSWSVTSATITVTLSGPPPRSASWTSRSTQAAGSGYSRSVCPIVSALTTPDRPSLQIRYRSPGSAWRTEYSGSMSRPSSARVSSERCGWLLASSALIRPSSTSICT